MSVPEPAVRHLVRRDLLKRCMPTNQRVTVLLAGGGFGKTTLLAECCRALRAGGVPTTWLSLDERDDPVMLDNYLALAFQHAGVDVLGPLRSENTDLDVPGHRTALLVRAIEAHPGPCVLALDELERLRDPRSVALLNSLLQSNPDGMHVSAPLSNGILEILPRRQFTAAWVADSVPSGHQAAGTEFTVRVQFSEDAYVSYLVLRDAALTVTNGTCTKFRRVDGRNDLREAMIAPDGTADVSLVLDSRPIATRATPCARRTTRP